MMFLDFVRSAFGALDKHIIQTILLRSWNIIAGGITLILIPFTLRPDVAGYYFTFGSLLLIQVFFELGLSSVIVVRSAQFLSGGGAGAEHHAPDLSRLSGMVMFLQRYYLAMALMFLAIAWGSGWFFFARAESSSAIDWTIPWGLTSLFTAANLYLSFKLALEEGAGAVAAIARLRRLQSIVGHVGFWATLLLHQSLYAAIWIPMVSCLMTSFHVFRKDSVFRRARAQGSTSVAAFSWLKEIFPLQWKVALSWSAGYLIFQLYTPFVFNKFGPAAAGKVGLSLAVFNAVLTLSQSVVSASSPRYVAMVTRRDFSTLNHQFVRHAAISFFCVCMAVLSLMLGHVVASLYFPFFSVRLVDAASMAAIGVSTIVNSMVLSMATYLRAFGDEPMLWSSLVGAMATPLLIWLGSGFGLTGIFVAVAAWGLAVGLPWAACLFRGAWRSTAQPGLVTP